MLNIFVPNHFCLFEGNIKDNNDVEILEVSATNLSGECLHKFEFNITDRLKGSYDNIFLKEFKEDVQDSHISIRECTGGIQVVTSLRFLGGKLGNILNDGVKINEMHFPANIYFLFFIKSILYMINYYYFIKNEKDIRIQKDAFQTLYIGKADNYTKLLSIFPLLQVSLIDIGFFGFLFQYEKVSDQYVFQHSAFLILLSSDSDNCYTFLKVLL